MGHLPVSPLSCLQEVSQTGLVASNRSLFQTVRCLKGCTPRQRLALASYGGIMQPF
jgi:hypothetical protein